jgi:ferric-dicitrate binding protein FerR (iron transport regulator)
MNMDRHPERRAPEPDADFERELTAELRPLRWSGRVPELPERAGRARPRRRAVALRWAAVAAAGLLLALVRDGLRDGPHDGPAAGASYPLVPLAADRALPERLEFGDVLETGPGERVALTVPEFGQVLVEPGTRLEVLTPTDPDARHSLFLARGEVRASIVGGPRAFQLATPAGVGVDLGCAYTMGVDADGETRLRVTEGVVSFERLGQRRWVPAGAELTVHPGRALGLPRWTGGDATFSAALERLETPAPGAGPPDWAADLALLAAAGAERGSLGLFHLAIAAPSPALRRAAYDQLVELCPAPRSATRERTVHGEPTALQLWSRALPWMR